MNNYKIITKLEELKGEFWDVVAKCGHSSFFQTNKAIQFFREHGYDVITVAVFKSEKFKAFISAVIQKESGLQSYFSRRAITFGGPVFSEDVQEEDIDILLQEMKKVINGKAIYLETRNFNDYGKYKDIFKRNGYVYNAHLNFHLDCTNEEQTTKNISKSKLRYIRKSLREGVEIIEAENEKQIFQYFQILEDLYKNKVKTPLPSLQFFVDLYEQKVAKFLLLEYNKEIIGGTVITELNNEIVYEWYVCGNDDKYKSLRPSTLATWAVIDYALKNGIKKFDFMGAGKPNEAYGVRDFKASFGGELVEHGRFVFVASPFLYWLGTKAVALKKKI